MERQEAERYKNWDKELNEIYGVLKEQLSIEQMDKLRVEQRNWVEHRNEVAKESSLRYEGDQQNHQNMWLHKQVLQKKDAMSQLQTI